MIIGGVCYYNINNIHPVKRGGFYTAGAMILFISLFVALVFFLMSKKREMVAYSKQASLLIKKEKIEEMTPTVGKSLKSIAKDIKEGIDEDKQEH